MMLPFLKKASVSVKTFRQEHVFQIFILSVSEFKLAFLLNPIGFHRFSSLNKVFVLGFYGPIFLRRFRLYVLSFMFRFMFANICFEKNQNIKIYVMFIINIT